MLCFYDIIYEILDNIFMDLTSFASIFQGLIIHGYVLMFLLMCVEGPIITTAAAFAVSLGYFNLSIVFILSILGDVIPDTIYYFIGYFARHSVINKYGHRFGLSTARMEKIESHLTRHAGKTITALKLTPIIALPGFMIVGSARYSYWKYILVCTLVSLVKTAIFMAVGYYFGHLYNLGQYLEYSNLFLFGILILLILFYLIYKKVGAWLGRKIEKI